MITKHHTKENYLHMKINGPNTIEIAVSKGSLIVLHMGDFTQPQQKYAGSGENCNIAILAIYYSVINTL